MPEVLLSLGSNIEPLHNLQSALAALDALPDARLGRGSALYRCPAVGFSGPDFVNCAYRADWAAGLPELQAALRAIEDAAQRDRSAERFASRTLDIDIVLFGDVVSREGSGIPRGELLEQAFVLRPCAELAPDWVHPLTGLSLAAHWQTWRLSGDDPLLPV